MAIAPVEPMKREEAPLAPAQPPQAAAVARREPIRIEDKSVMAAWMDTGRFEQVQRIAKVFCESDMVPKHFYGKIGNCVIAVQLAARMNMDPFMVMQNCYVVHGRPGFEGKFIIALINASGLFVDPLDFEYGGTGDGRFVDVSAKRKSTGKECRMRFHLKTAKDEGWISGNKKWQSMTEQMMAYRGAAFFARVYCPEVLMGVQTTEELQDAPRDIVDAHVTQITDDRTAQLQRDLARAKSELPPPAADETDPPHPDVNADTESAPPQFEAPLIADIEAVVNTFTNLPVHRKAIMRALQGSDVSATPDVRARMMAHAQRIGEHLETIEPGSKPAGSNAWEALVEQLSA